MSNNTLRPNVHPVILSIGTTWPFVFIGRKEQLDLHPQPKFCVFINTSNRSKRVYIKR